MRKTHGNELPLSPVGATHMRRFGADLARGSLRYALCASVLFLMAVATAWTQKSTKSLRLRRAPSAIEIDGRIESAWMAADSVADFEQFQPYHGKPPSRRTIAKVLATDEALYCLMLCEDDPANIQTNTGVLDDYGGDVVSLMLDTFGDKQTAYKFAVSAGGVRGDCRLLDDARNRDYAWDGVWFSAARTYGWGYAVEMRIPFRSIQYDGSLTVWGLDFDRWRPTDGEDIYWCAYQQNEGQRISRFGTLLLDEIRPTAHGLGLEFYPVGLLKAHRIESGAMKVDPDAGLDIFYNPSKTLTFQLTANPDFAQIEADPFEFNISRYETYYSERRPFFTEGNEVFMASGKQRNSGFYSPLELFYSRRIGRILPDGSMIPLSVGAKAFGRWGDVEYGGFVARAAEQEYGADTAVNVVPGTTYAAGRVKSSGSEKFSIGALAVGAMTGDKTNAVLDIDGVVRDADWQLAWQLARSQRENKGDYAASAGFTLTKEHWAAAVKARAIGNRFDIDDVGFVPWRGLSDIVALIGPRWYFEEGSLRELSTYGGGSATYEHADLYTDRKLLAGFNMQFRSNWGGEFNFEAGRSRDSVFEYTSSAASLATWFSISPKWSAAFWSEFAHTYNFRRGYEGDFFRGELEASWRPWDMLQVGSSFQGFVEWDPDRHIEDITWNTRPFLSFIPVNDLSIYAYVDISYIDYHSSMMTDRVEQILAGLRFAWQFLPKSWLYLAINEVQQRGEFALSPLTVRDRAAVLKLKYLYYL